MNQPVTYQDLLAYAVELGEQMRAAIVKRHEDEGQKATGRTSRSLHIEPTTDGFKFVGWKYVGSYEEGRKPGTMPPTEAIIEWAQAKHITFKTDAQMRSFAFCLARKIARDGTKRYRLAQKGQQPDILRTPIEQMREELTKVTQVYFEQQITQQLFRADIKNQ